MNKNPAQRAEVALCADSFYPTPENFAKLFKQFRVIWSFSSPRIDKGYEWEWNLLVNPHKRNKDAETGRFITVYNDVKQTIANIQEVLETLEVKEYALARVDICFDFQTPYSQMAKLIHLFMLMYAECYKLTNVYSSVDERSKRGKAFTVENGRGNLQIQHYDRALRQQNRYDVQVRNRLEFRMPVRSLNYTDLEFGIFHTVKMAMGQCGTAMSREVFAAVEERIAKGLVDEWKRARDVAGLGDIGQFIRANHERIYSRRQIRRMFELAGKKNPVQSTNDFTKQSSGFRTELFKLEDMRQFQWRLEDFAREFVAPLPFEWYDENDLKNSRVNPCTFSEDEPLTSMDENGIICDIDDGE